MATTQRNRGHPAGVRYPKSASTAKQGMRFVQGVVEDADSIFLPIAQENDLGVDAFVDLVHEGEPANRQFALQIKSGASYYDTKRKRCHFAIKRHRQYWSEHRLPVYAIVYVPALGHAYWVNVKGYLKRHPQATRVEFAASQANRFDAASFVEVFKPSLLSQTPQLTFEKSLALVESAQFDEISLGAFVLFSSYADRIDTWEAFVACFRRLPDAAVPPALVHFLAFLPGHTDFAFGPRMSMLTRERGLALLYDFGEVEVRKLLAQIDEENRIARGTLGQSVEAVVSSLPDVEPILERIACSSTDSMFLRESAALILGMHLGLDAAPVLQRLQDEGSRAACLWLEYVTQGWRLDPYS